MKVSGDQQLFGSSEFFKITFFVLNIRNKQIWNDMRVNKWWQLLFFGRTVPLMDQNVANLIYGSYVSLQEYLKWRQNSDQN